MKSPAPRLAIVGPAQRAAPNSSSVAAPAPPSQRNAARNVIRRAIAGGILLALWYFDRLRLREFSALSFDVRWVLPAVALFLPNYLTAALRLRVILTAMKVPAALRQTWTWTLDAALGDLVLPVVVGGDLVKTARIAHSANRAVGVAAAVADRAVGFFGATALASVAAVLMLYRLDLSGPLRNLLLAAFFCCSIGCGCGVGVAIFRRPVTRYLMRFARIARFVSGLLQAADDFSSWFGKPKAVALSLGYAVLGHLCWCTTAWCLTRALRVEVDAVALFPVLPLVILANTVSVAGGIGGGLVAFEYLFQHVLGAAPGQGAHVGLAMIAVTNVSKLFAIPQLVAWLRTGRPPTSTADPTTAGDAAATSADVGRRAA